MDKKRTKGQMDGETQVKTEKRVHTMAQADKLR